MGNFVFVLSHEAVDSATRCFQLAKIAHTKGHTVNLFFVDDGVLWADKTRDFKAKSGTGDCPEDYFPYLVEHEVPVSV
jgi:tRNA 2-thiouridine synthesizing protein D